jgi:hypothetical protein
MAGKMKRFILMVISELPQKEGGAYIESGI